MVRDVLVPVLEKGKGYQAGRGATELLPKIPTELNPAVRVVPISTGFSPVGKAEGPPGTTYNLQQPLRHKTEIIPKPARHVDTNLWQSWSNQKGAQRGQKPRNSSRRGQGSGVGDNRSAVAALGEPGLESAPAAGPESKAEEIPSSPVRGNRIYRWLFVDPRT